MSPEQINQDPKIDHRTDIYSLGAVIYEVLCAKTPVGGEKLHEVLDSVLNITPANPSVISSQVIPPVLEQMAMRCLQKRATDRYQSMSEIVQLLKQQWHVV